MNLEMAAGIPSLWGLVALGYLLGSIPFGYLLVRATGGGDIRFQTSSIRGAGPLFGNAVLPLVGTRPAYPGHAPPVVENVACYKNAAPALNRVTTGGTP